MIFYTQVMFRSLLLRITDTISWRFGVQAAETIMGRSSDRAALVPVQDMADILPAQFF